MKTAKQLASIGSLFLAIMIVFSLSSCSGNDKTAEAKILNIFTNEEKPFYVPESVIKPPKEEEAHYSLMLYPKKGFEEVCGALAENANYKFTKHSDEVGILTEIGNDETYTIVKTANNVFTLTNPYVVARGYKRNEATNTSEKVGQYICFPFYFLEDAETISFSQELELDKEYETTCTKEQMKEFYVNMGKFNVEDTDDGFFVNGYSETPKLANRFDKMSNYKFTFSEKDGDTYLVLSNV